MNDRVGVRRRSNGQFGPFFQQLRVLRCPRGIKGGEVVVSGAHVGGSGELSKVVTFDAEIKATVLGRGVVGAVERIFRVVRST